MIVNKNGILHNMKQISEEQKWKASGSHLTAKVMLWLQILLIEDQHWES